MPAAPSIVTRQPGDLTPAQASRVFGVPTADVPLHLRGVRPLPERPRPTIPNPLPRPGHTAGEPTT